MVEKEKVGNGEKEDKKQDTSEFLAEIAEALRPTKEEQEFREGRFGGDPDKR
jgi:hypothetical protein